VAASSRRTDEKVASRRGSGKHWRSASRARALSLKLAELATSKKDGHGVCIPKEAPNNVLEQANGLLLHKLVDHVAEYGADSVKALVGLTDVGKTDVV